jgi:lipopolysaccharide/colanic/teichoic acid biosynthesis glycosyltransferase
LESEVAEFDPALLERLRVKPGVSGLWQVEGRDSASFDSYRRLDLFYVENWSIGLDLVIIASTVGAVLARALHRTTVAPPAAGPASGVSQPLHRSA